MFNKPLTFFNEASRNFYKVLNFFVHFWGKMKGNCLCLSNSPISYYKDTTFFRQNKIVFNSR